LTTGRFLFEDVVVRVGNVCHFERRLLRLRVIDVGFLSVGHNACTIMDEKGRVWSKIAEDVAERR